MDELEFRRNAMIHPDDQQPEFLAVACTSQQNQHYLEEMKQLDQTLHKAMAVEVPAGLAERILLRQALLRDDLPSSDKQRATVNIKAHLPTSSGTSWRQLAMAASVAFLLGMSTRWISLPTEPHSSPSLAQVAMAHVYEEAPFIEGTDERVNLHSINSKMEKYGATMSGMEGLKVTYVNHCAFYQGPALHMVIDGEMGPVTLFLVPKHVPLSVQSRFEDGTLKGEILPLHGANMVLIGQMKEPLEPVASRLLAKLHWSI